VPRRRPHRPRRRVLVADALPGTADKASCSGVAFGQRKRCGLPCFSLRQKEQATVVVVPGALFESQSLSESDND
jgi:hypothetical protein